MQWILEQRLKNESHQGRIIKNKETRGRKLDVDKSIKACPICRRTWEKVNPAKHNGQDVLFYRIGHIPTYGKKKVICKRCK
mgnify:FL=1